MTIKMLQDLQRSTPNLYGVHADQIHVGQHRGNVAESSSETSVESED